MNSIMAKWEELPIADRAQYMRIAVQNGYRDIRSIREAYNIYAEGGTKGGPEDENNINLNWDKVARKPAPLFGLLGEGFPDLEREYKEAKNFVSAYIKSPGFRERLNTRLKAENNPQQKDYIAKQQPTNYPELKFNMPNTSYNTLRNQIWNNGSDNKIGIELGAPREQYIYTHELGHWLDGNYKTVHSGNPKWNGPDKMSYFYPELVPSKPTNKHDIKASEQYADLLMLRNELYRMGIFNSLKQNSKNPFTKDHLKIFKKFNPKFRMFNNFTDDEIVNLMNTIAYNPTYNTEYTNQAAYGGNLYETGGPKGTKKVGPTYNPKTKTWTNSKGQNITGKSFKGKYGTTTYLNSGAVDLDASAVSGKYNDHRWRYASNAPRVYIGGTTNEARQKYFDTDTELTNTVKTMAKKYGISPNVLASRIAKEGPIDEAIKNYNNTNGYFQRGDMIGPIWGLDDMGTWITNGKVKLRKGLMVDTDYEMENEKGRTTYSVGSDNYMDGVELTAVALKYFKDQMRQKYPKASEAQLEQYATAAFNTGMTGAINLINQGKIKDAYKPFIKVKKNGGYIRKLLTKPN